MKIGKKAGDLNFSGGRVLFEDQDKDATQRGHGYRAQERRNEQKPQNK